MTASLVARHKVNDFAHWKKGYDEAASMRQGGGVIEDRVHRDLDDPNMVTVYHRFADASAAKAFAASMDTKEMQEIFKNAGVSGPVEIILREDVE